MPSYGFSLMCELYDPNELLAQADRAAPDRDLLGREVQVVGECRLEIHAPVVGVAVDEVGSPFDRGPDAGQRAEHRLVAGQFDGTGHGLAGHVDAKPCQLVAQAGSHFDSLRPDCVQYGRFPERVGTLRKSKGGVPERPNGAHC